MFEARVICEEIQLALLHRSDFAEYIEYIVNHFWYVSLPHQPPQRHAIAARNLRLIQTLIFLRHASERRESGAIDILREGQELEVIRVESFAHAGCAATIE